MVQTFSDISVERGEPDLVFRLEKILARRISEGSGSLKHLGPNLSNATIRNPQAARSGER
jgi:hypothetical protein